jgi:uncharacterized membrane protein (UPF0127 family)
VHLPVAVHRHPRAGDDPDRQELRGRGLSDLRAALVARNLTRSTTLASDLEVAGSLWAKFMGLMGRPSLGEGAGLWLPDSNGIHMMFMRFPIDAVFLGKPGRAGAAGGDARPVISVHPALRAWTGLVPFVRGGNGVLELPVGTIAASGTMPGDLIRLD